MVVSRDPHKYGRITITLIPTADESSFKRVPSTFSLSNRTYTWRHFEQIDYMIVPRSVSNSEVKVDIFVESLKHGRSHNADIQKTVQQFVRTKMQTSWKGFKLGGISKPANVAPPEETFKRGTIEEILGSSFES